MSKLETWDFEDSSIPINNKFPLGQLQFYIFAEIVFGIRCTLIGGCLIRVGLYSSNFALYNRLKLFWKICLKQNSKCQMAFYFSHSTFPNSDDCLRSILWSPTCVPTCCWVDTIFWCCGSSYILFSVQTGGGEKQTFSELQDNSELIGVAVQLPYVSYLQWYLTQTVLLCMSCRPVAFLSYISISSFLYQVLLIDHSAFICILVLII